MSIFIRFEGQEPVPESFLDDEQDPAGEVLALGRTWKLASFDGVTALYREELIDQQ